MNGLPLTITLTHDQFANRPEGRGDPLETRENGY